MKKQAGISRRPAAKRASELSSDIALRIARLLGAAEDLTTSISSLTLHQRTAPTEPCPATYEPGVIVIAQGRKQVDLGPNTFICDPSRFLLTAVDLSIVTRVVDASEKTPFIALLIKVDMPMVRELVSKEEIHGGIAPSDAPAMVTGEATAEFLGACYRLLDLLDSPKDIPFLGSHIQREIIYRILQGEEGARLRSIATLGDQSQRTARAIAWIKANFAKPLRVGELARMAGMSVSTFHHHFRVLTTLSPLQYQKQLRLQAARRRMLVDGLDAASAAFAVGYESASQFNREYSRFFGQPPMRDIRARPEPGASLLEVVGR